MTSGGCSRSGLSATVSMSAFLLCRVFAFRVVVLVYFLVEKREVWAVARVFGCYCDYGVIVIGCITSIDSGMGGKRCWVSMVMVGSGSIIFVVG